MPLDYYNDDDIVDDYDDIVDDDTVSVDSDDSAHDDPEFHEYLARHVPHLHPYLRGSL